MTTMVISVNGNRLWDCLMKMAEIGGTPNGGVCRVALTDEDKQGRDLFVSRCKDAGCSIEIDQMGNIFAKRPGKNNALPAVMVGSHLDSQPTGGKFDGVYGVLAGLEVVKTLNDYDILTEHPIEVVSWTNEEGARFAPAMISSGVFANEFSLEYAYSRKDKEGKLFGEELERIGYKGSIPVGNRPYKATFEVHIEQGPVLEAEKKSVGIVTGVQGILWYDLIFYGKETHAGPAPMRFRKDPMKAAFPILSNVYELASAYGPEARVTIGSIDAFPGVHNTVPGSLTVSVDLRHPDASILNSMDADLKKIVNGHNRKSAVVAKLKEIWYSPPISFAPECFQAIKNAVKKLDIPAMELVSGAGHDAAYISKVAPTGMIFIPCKDGLSHNESESAEKEDIINGANVLLHAVLEISKN